MSTSIKIQSIPDENPTDWIVQVHIGTYYAYSIHIPNRHKYANMQKPRAWHYGITVYAYLPNWNGSGAYDNRQVSATCSPDEILNWLRYSLQISRDTEREIVQVLGTGGWTR